jgi:predicted PurR-regulated permease PerM
MGEDKIQELLLQLVQDMSFVKAKLSNIEEQKLAARIDQLEAQNREHDKTIKSLENRSNTMEQFVRNNMSESKKQQTSIFISMGMAVFSAVISLIFSFLG